MNASSVAPAAFRATLRNSKLFSEHPNPENHDDVGIESVSKKKRDFALAFSHCVLSWAHRNDPTKGWGKPDMAVQGRAPDSDNFKKSHQKYTFLATSVTQDSKRILCMSQCI